MRIDKSGLVLLGAIGCLAIGSVASLSAQPSPATGYNSASGTAAPLGYVLWAAEPGVVPPGQTATIEDGNGVELISRAASYTSNNGVDPVITRIARRPAYQLHTVAVFDRRRLPRWDHPGLRRPENVAQGRGGARRAVVTRRGARLGGQARHRSDREAPDGPQKY